MTTPHRPAPALPDTLPYSAAAERNRGPVLAELQRLWPTQARVLEVASGTGQHAQYMAEQQPGWHWQPTEADATLLPAIDTRCRGLANVQAALHLDLLQAAAATAGGLGAPGTAPSWDGLLCMNMLHIAPWATCAALMGLAAASLRPDGRLVLYGPYREAGVPTAPSNEAFDQSLRARDPAWGLRDRAAVEAEARQVGLALTACVAMPANNLLLVFSRVFAAPLALAGAETT